MKTGIKKPRSYKEIVKIPTNLIKYLPTSYDVIGNIALLKIPENIKEYKSEIAKSFLNTYKNISTVCEISPVKGELRKREIKIIGGEKNLETVHKEYGSKFKLNIEKTYFSPRLANERKNIADQVKENEIIVDMFSGIAPFPIIIAKYSNPKIIFAIEKNKDAVKYAKENIKINKVLDVIEIINADAKDIDKILQQKKIDGVDRIIMNLPFLAYRFFNKALKLVKNETIIHYFDFLSDEKIKERTKYLQNVAKKNNIKLVKLNYEKIKSYSPREFYIRIDITAKKN